MQLLRPIESRVTASDDDDALAAKLLWIRHAIEDSSTVPRLCALLRQASRRERSNPGRDDNGAARESIGLSDQNEVIVVPLECGHVLIKVRLEMELRRLFDERIHHVLGQNLGEAANVEDVLLGVERGELAAELGQGVNDAGRCPTHSRVKSGEQSGGTAADDSDVGYFVSHLYCEIYSSGNRRPRLASLLATSAPAF